MKKVLFGALALALVAGSFTSCKKGENDPGLSFKSRKGRMAGEYTISKMSVTSTSTSGGSTTTETTTIDGTTLTITQSSGGSSTTTTGTVNTADMTINKDGTYNMVLDFSISQDIFGTTYTTTTNNNDSGNWSFLGKDKDGEWKNKERVVFNVTNSVSTDTQTGGGSTTTSTSTNTYGNGENSSVMAIDQLRSKEIVFKADYASSYTDGTNSSSSTEMTEITLTAK